MKRCPECYERYNDEAQFCEADGHQLLADPAALPKPEAVVETAAAPDRSISWPAVALGVLIGLIFGAGVFAVSFMVSTPESNERPPTASVPEVHEKTLPHREVTASNSVPTPEPEASP